MPRRFCDECDVAMELHSLDEPDPADCRAAGKKARVLNLMYGAFGTR